MIEEEQLEEEQVEEEKLGPWSVSIMSNQSLGDCLVRTTLEQAGILEAVEEPKPILKTTSLDLWSRMAEAAASASPQDRPNIDGIDGHAMILALRDALFHPKPEGSKEDYIQLPLIDDITELYEILTKEAELAKESVEYIRL